MTSAYAPSIQHRPAPPVSPTRTTSSNLPNATPHAVSRSAELLSCAKTAVKIAKSQHNQAPPPPPPPGTWWAVNPSDLQLYNLQYFQQQNQHQVLEDGVSILRTMDAELKQLESLVRRRGQTNDPTEEITLSVNRLQADTQELTHLIQTMVPAQARGQRQRHWKILQQWFQTVAQQQGKRLKEILKVRADVLKEQARRRGRFQASSTNRGPATALDSPLFSAPRPPPPSLPVSAAMKNGTTHVNGTTAPSQTAPAHPSSAPPSTTLAPVAATTTASHNNYSYYAKTNGSIGYSGGGYGGSSMGRGGGYGGGGYGGRTAYHSTGMRQRRIAVQDQEQKQEQEQNHFQAQLIQRQQQRQTVQRMQEARQAEKGLVELGTLFGKMSTLITQQSEVIDKVEDDVEAAFMDVSAGQQEITTLYSLKKGNRALILKVFGLLIFFIIFMKFYKSK